MCFNITKAIKKTYIQHHTKRENLKPFPLKAGSRQVFPFSPFLLHIILEFLITATRQEDEIKGIQIGKEEVKLFLFANDMILYLKELENFTKKFLDIINTCIKVVGYKINSQKSADFLYTSN
jgi:hypothetical protein